MMQMKLQEVAQAYTRCVELEEQARMAQSEKEQELASVRENLFALLTEALREARISFRDDADASRLAFEIVNSAKG